jgi:hypothetical protein
MSRQLASAPCLKFSELITCSRPITKLYPTSQPHLLSEPPAALQPHVLKPSNRIKPREMIDFSAKLYPTSQPHLLNEPPAALEPRVFRPLQLVLDAGVGAAIACCCTEGCRVMVRQAQNDWRLCTRERGSGTEGVLSNEVKNIEQ